MVSLFSTATAWSVVLAALITASSHALPDVKNSLKRAGCDAEPVHTAGSTPGRLGPLLRTDDVLLQHLVVVVLLGAEPDTGRRILIAAGSQVSIIRLAVGTRHENGVATNTLEILATVAWMRYLMANMSKILQAVIWDSHHSQDDKDWCLHSILCCVACLLLVNVRFDSVFMIDTGPVFIPLQMIYGYR